MAYSARTVSLQDYNYFTFPYVRDTAVSTDEIMYKGTHNLANIDKLFYCLTALKSGAVDHQILIKVGTTTEATIAVNNLAFQVYSDYIDVSGYPGNHDITILLDCLGAGYISVKDVNLHGVIA